DAEDGGGEAMFVQEREQRLGAAGIAAGRNESVASEITSQGAGFAKDPGAEDDAGGGGEFEAHGGRVLPILCGGKYLGALHRDPRLGHHGSHGVTPDLVMPGFLVRGGSLGGAIGFDENEARGIVLVLDDIEAGDARLLDAGGGVGKRGLFESVDAIGFDVNLNVDDE